MDEQLRVIPIHRALTRPQLLMGCERVLFLMLCMVVTLLAGPGGIASGNIVNIAFSVVVFIGGRAALTRMAKTDARMSEIFRRSCKYRAEYLACSTVACKDENDLIRRW